MYVWSWGRGGGLLFSVVLMFCGFELCEVVWDEEEEEEER